jgi:hypothetical protein
MSSIPKKLLQRSTATASWYVIVGGVEAVAHGSTLPTEDVDVTPARDRDISIGWRPHCASCERASGATAIRRGSTSV